MLPSGVTATARPGSSTSAWNGSTAPLVASTAAYRACALPPTEVKSPPRYTVSFVTASARTVADTLGWKFALGVQVAMSMAARLLTCVPLTAPK